MNYTDIISIMVFVGLLLLIAFKADVEWPL